MSATHHTKAVPGFGALGESGFTGAGRVHIARPFILSSFLSRRQKEGHGGPRSVAVLHHQELTERVIGLAIEVHRHRGPGLLESFDAAALCREPQRADIPVRREVGIPVMYKGEPLPLGFRADILADETVILEIKAVPALLPVHDMQLQTYLRMSGLPVVLLLNFHALRLKDGLRRFVG
jgi:GxxExxY protein